MVQFKRDLDLPRAWEPDNTYWAIGGTAVETASMRSTSKKNFGEYMPRPTAGDDAVANFDRKDRGHPNYGKCLVNELKELIRARNINVPDSCVRKEDLIAELEKADNNVKFTKFFELPAELRTNIYGKCFKSLGDLPLLPHQPPLLFASSKTRSEALPEYYAHSTFTLGFVTNFTTPAILHGGRSCRHLRTTVHRNTLDLLKRVSDTDFAGIKHLKVQIWKPELDVEETIVSFATWTADLSGSTGSVIIHENQDYRSNVWAPVFKAVGEALEPALEEIRKRPVAQRVGKADVYALMDVIHTAMM